MAQRLGHIRPLTCTDDPNKLLPRVARLLRIFGMALANTSRPHSLEHYSPVYHLVLHGSVIPLPCPKKSTLYAYMQAGPHLIRICLSPLVPYRQPAFLYISSPPHKREGQSLQPIVVLQPKDMACTPSDSHHAVVPCWKPRMSLTACSPHGTHAPSGYKRLRRKRAKELAAVGFKKEEKNMSK